MECVRLVIPHSLLHRPSLHLFPIPFYRTDVRFVNVAFVTLDSTTLLYTYISRFSANPHYQQQLYLRPSFIPIFNFSHKQPTFAFTGESGYTLGFRRKIAHKGLPFCGHSVALCCQRNCHRENSRRKRMHACGVCPLPPASRPRWAAQSCCCCPFSVFGWFEKT